MVATILSTGREVFLRKLLNAQDWIAVVSLSGPEKTMMPYFLYQSVPWIDQQQIDGVPRIRITDAGRAAMFRHDDAKTP